MKFKSIAFSLICIFIVSFTFSVNNDIGDKAKLVLAKQKMYGGQYNAALKIYKELQVKYPNDSEIYFNMGYCYYELNNYNSAFENFSKAKEIGKGVNSQTYLYLGLLYQKKSDFNKAIEEFNTFKSNTTNQKEIQESDVDVYISQCNNAINMIKNPVNVKVINVGQDINSKYDDQTPCISADGQTLVFNSRRPEDTNSPTDVEGDGKYFQDIYISHFDTLNKKWKVAESVPGSINTEAHDACTSISPDGKIIFIYKNDTKDHEASGGDIFISKIMKNKWKTPEPIGKPINTSYWEGGACLSPDGKTLYFTSERKGGFGHSDIWMSKKISAKEWSKPENLGNTVNSPYDEVGIFMAPDGKTLFFCSNGPKSMGNYDIFKTVYENGKWSEPVNLGYPINTEFRDGPITIDASGRTAYISSDRPGGLGETDIYMVDISEYPIMAKDPSKATKYDGLSIIKGTVRDGFEGFGVANATVEFLDENNNIVSSTSTNENGEYFITLKGDAKYIIKVSLKGFQPTSETVMLKKGVTEAFVQVKDFLLKK